MEYLYTLTTLDDHSLSETSVHSSIYSAFFKMYSILIRMSEKGTMDQTKAQTQINALQDM